MKGLREKFRNNKGFTLIEMLIVVAIIAILIAVSIPLVGSVLEKARDATDKANERAAKAEAAVVFLGVNDGSFTDHTGDFYYDAKNGKLVASKDDIDAYGQCSQTHTDGTLYPDEAENAGAHTGKIIKVNIAATGDITITWDTAS